MGESKMDETNGKIENFDEKNHESDADHKETDVIQKGNKKTYFTIGVIIIILMASVAVFLLHKPDSSCSGDVCDFTGNAVGNAVAVFNGKTIYSSELDKSYNLVLFMQGIPESYASLVPKDAVLNQTIIQELLYDEAVDNGFTLTKEDAEDKLKTKLADKGLEFDNFKAGLENKSFGYSFFIEYNRKNRVIGKFLDESLFSGLSVNEKEASDYYNSNKDYFKVEEQINASHILVNTSSEAKEIIKGLDSGKDFSKLAIERSIDPSAVSNGGNLGYFSRGRMVSEFEDAAFALENVGDYTKEPVKTQYGYHIIKLTGREEARQLSFEEVKDQIVQGLLQQEKDTVLKKHIDNLYKNADIKIYLEEDTPTKALETNIESDTP